MMKKTMSVLSVVALLVALTASGCTKKVDQPVPPAPTEIKVPEPRQVDLTEVKYQDLLLQKVFDDFSGVADYALIGGQLRYLSNQQLWTTSFDGEHSAVETALSADYETWYPTISAKHHDARETPEELPSYLADVPVNQGRYKADEFLLAFSGLADHTALFLTEPGGQLRAVLRDAQDLKLLGWASRASLVFYADLPDLGPNVYILDVWSDFVVPMRSAYSNSMTVAPPIVGAAFVGQTGLMWRYDGTRLAYGFGNIVYVLDGSGVHRQIYLGNAPVVWAERNLMITADTASKTPPELRFGDRQKTLKTLRDPLIIEADWKNQRLFYVFTDGTDVGLAVVDLQDMNERELLFAAEGYYISAFALSPDAEQFIFVQAATLAPEDGPYDDYRNEVYLYDLLSGNMQALTGFGLDDEASMSLIAAAHWVADDKLLLGWKFGGSPAGEKWINEYAMTQEREVVSAKNWELHVQVKDKDSGKLFLSNYSSAEGYWDFVDEDLWHYDFDGEEEPLRLTVREPWEVNKNRALAYKPSKQWLFVLREKGWESPDWTGQIFHGVILNMSGHEYTVLTSGLIGQEEAVWVGNNLYVQLRDRIIRLGFP